MARNFYWHLLCEPGLFQVLDVFWLHTLQLYLSASFHLKFNNYSMLVEYILYCFCNSVHALLVIRKQSPQTIKVVFYNTVFLICIGNPFAFSQQIQVGDSISHFRKFEIFFISNTINTR